MAQPDVSMEDASSPAAGVGGSDIIAMSHYRVCRKMAVNYDNRPRVPALVPVAPPELVFVPLSLKEAAATAVIRWGLHNYKNFPGDVRELIDKLVTQKPKAFLAKERSCPEVTFLRVGRFDDFPNSRDAVCPAVYSTNIIAQARAVLNFLLDCESITALDNIDVVRSVIQDRYLPFLRVQAAHLGTVLVPPVDVQAVWLSHMLNSLQYSEFAAGIAPGLQWIPHPVVRCLTPAERTKAEDVCKKLLDIPWELPKALGRTKNALGPVTVVVCDPTDIRDDRMWAREFRRICSGNRSDYLTDAFLFRCLKGYQRYLYLISKNTRQIEFEGFSPPPPIDLIWHTHLLQPLVYDHDARRLVGQVHHHKLLPPHLRTKANVGMTLPGKEENEQKLWRQEFGENLHIYVGLPADAPNPAALAAVLALPTVPAGIPIPAPSVVTIAACQRGKVCTWHATFRAFEDQVFYRCTTCKMPSDEGCCLGCARRCHAGHVLYQQSGSFYCDCGDTPHCKSRNPLTIADCHEQGICTLLVTGTTSFAVQPMWRCRTCKMPDDEAVCKACWARCHSGHKAYDEKPITAAFYCDCGKGCKLT